MKKHIVEEYVDDKGEYYKTFMFKGQAKRFIKKGHCMLFGLRIKDVK